MNPTHWPETDQSRRMKLRVPVAGADGLAYVPLEQTERLLSIPGGVFWLDVQDPTPSDMQYLERVFGFHHLALEDAYKQHQRPKIEEYPDFCFIVMYTLAAAEAAGASINVATAEISIFLGRNYLVTVHRGQIPRLEEAAGRWAEVRGNIGDDPAALLYALLDTIVDGYFPVVDRIADTLDDIEEQIIERFDQRLSLSLFTLRRQMITLRRVLAPEREILNGLLRRDGDLLSHTARLHLQDVYDHVLRVLDTVDTYRDMLAGDLDVYLSAVSNSLNQVMKTLTAISAMLMTASLIAGVYGMNVAFPGRDEETGFRWAIGLMVFSVAALGWLFRRLRWF